MITACSRATAVQHGLPPPDPLAKASARQRSNVATLTPTSRDTCSTAELSGGSSRATILYACPYRATSVAQHLSRLCFTLCGTWAMSHARSRDRIRKNGKISGFGARAEAEGLDCRGRRSWLDRLVGQPRRRGLSNLWYGAQSPARLICPAASGLAGARDVGLDPGHAKGPARPGRHASHVTKWDVGRSACPGGPAPELHTE
jgi:hypothetical protein